MGADRAGLPTVAGDPASAAPSRTPEPLERFPQPRGSRWEHWRSSKLPEFLEVETAERRTGNRNIRGS